VSDAQFGAALRLGVAAVVAAVVGQDPFDGDATFGEPGHSPVEERDEDDGVLDAGELAAGRPGVGVDDGVDVVVALASGRTGGYPRGGQRVCSQHWLRIAGGQGGVVPSNFVRVGTTRWVRRQSHGPQSAHR
jgi:hypothetical protein